MKREKAQAKFVKKQRAAMTSWGILETRGQLRNQEYRVDGWPLPCGNVIWKLYKVDLDITTDSF